MTTTVLWVPAGSRSSRVSYQWKGAGLPCLWQKGLVKSIAELDEGTSDGRCNRF